MHARLGGGEFDHSGRPAVPSWCSATSVSGAVGDPTGCRRARQGGSVVEVGLGRLGEGEVGRFAPMRVTSPADAFLTESQVALSASKEERQRSSPAIRAGRSWT